MEPLIDLVFSAVGTVASGALSGAGGETGRRISERLHGLLGRAGSEPGTPSGQQVLVLPVTEHERRAAAAQLVELARSSPEFAREVREWVREASWLAPRPVPAVAPGASRPQMLPPATAAFTDREDVLAWIKGLLDDAGRAPGAPVVATLTGQGGIGKTATVVRCAHELREEFPDGVLFVDLAGASAGTALTPSEALVRFLESLKVGTIPGDEARQRDLFREYTAGRRMIVVLDNALNDAQVLPLLPASPGCLVLVSSRHRLGRLVAEHGAYPLTLGPLSTADSVLLLRRVAGRARSGAPEEVVRAVAEGTGGIPLAVCTTGAGLAVREHLSWARVARGLSDRIDGTRQTGVTMGDTDPHAPADPVRLAQDVSYNELTPECAAFYRALAVWSWPTVTVLCAAHAAGVDEARARDMLEQLARVHLLEEVAEERYRFHDLARAHARELAVAEDGERRMREAVRRVAIAYLRFAAAADLRVIPHRWHLGPVYDRLTVPEHTETGDGARALAQLRAERENLAAVIHAAEHHGYDDLVWQLCEAMWSLHLRLGFHAQWIETHLRGVEAARRGAEEFGDRRALGRMLVQLAFAYMGVGDADKAEEALEAAATADAACGHLRGRATAVEALGLLRLKLWRHDEARHSFEEALRLLGRIREGDDGWQDVRRATELLKHHLGRVLAREGRFPAAFEKLNESLVGFRTLPGGADTYNEGRVYMSLGEAHLGAGDLELALVCLDKAVEAMATEGAGLQLADALEQRAECHRRAGRPELAAEDLRAAAARYEKEEDGTGARRARERLTALAG
ncbi:tetratricopeptide repeat protein [Streptomyces sp. WP-1]|uniref:tetratricopeptide repeat protein n=1 Tax=Streptomyces sp. WP-1 TaxID=3041497 RepID=UPI00264921FB|nr:tetratricopeptide repeat protein [Streptomyces sp. WP-1]WKE73001.1 NB-ARC domain-containing protein [Streptomyces sp. WP-1]